MAAYEDARLVCAFDHRSRFDSLFSVHLQGVLCIQGPRNHAHVLALGSDDDFEYTFRARVVFDQSSRRMCVAAARCERCWMGHEIVDPVQFLPIHDAIAANFGIELHAVDGCKVDPMLVLDAHSVMPWMDDVSGDMEACWASLHRRHAAMTIQRAWRARRWRRAVCAVANVVDRRLEAIKRRLWSPSGRLVARMLEKLS